MASNTTVPEALEGEVIWTSRRGGVDLRGGKGDRNLSILTLQDFDNRTFTPQTCTVPVSIASLMAMARLMSWVKTQP